MLSAAAQFKMDLLEWIKLLTKKTKHDTYLFDGQCEFFRLNVYTFKIVRLTLCKLLIASRAVIYYDLPKLRQYDQMIIFRKTSQSDQGNLVGVFVLFVN